RLFSAGALRAVRRCGVPAPDHVHECRQPAARAGDGTRARSGGSRRNRRQPHAARAAFITESVLLAAIGTALGLAVAVGSVKALVLVSPVPLPGLETADTVGVDAR